MYIFTCKPNTCSRKVAKTSDYIVRNKGLREIGASTYSFWWKISKIYCTTAITIASLKARRQWLMIHLCPLRGQSVWDRAVCGFHFFLAGMEPQDMISWYNITNNLPDFISNYLLQRDNVRIDENPLKPGRGRSSMLAQKYHCNFWYISLVSQHFQKEACQWIAGLQHRLYGSVDMPM